MIFTCISYSDNLPYEKVGKNEPVCIAEEVPFDIPDSWEWVRLEECTYSVGSKKNQIKTSEILEQGAIPVVSQGQKLIDGYYNNFDLIINDLPLIMFGDHTRNALCFQRITCYYRRIVCFNTYFANNKATWQNFTIPIRS